jgi:hypothetical protein
MVKTSEELNKIKRFKTSTYKNKNSLPPKTME